MSAPVLDHPDRPKRRSPWASVAVVVVLGLLILGMLAQALLEAKASALLPTGEPAPPFTAEQYGGGQLDLAQLRGKVVLLDFWATWCPPCREEMPILVKLAKEYQGRGLVFVAANRDEERAPVGVYLARVLPDLAPHTYFAGDPIAGAYRVHSLPTLYLIDREGKVTDAVSGSLSEGGLRRRIERALR